jgi:hypothetical protein
MESKLLDMFDEGYREAGISPSVRAEAFDDFLTMKSIAAKRTWTFGNGLGANAGAVCMGGHSKELVRNLCVRIDALTLAQLDAVTDVMECSKQEFVLEAVSSAIAKATTNLRAQGLSQPLEQSLRTQLEKAELSYEYSDDAKGGALRYRGELILNRDSRKHENTVNAVRNLIANGE